MASQESVLLLKQQLALLKTASQEQKSRATRKYALSTVSVSILRIGEVCSPRAIAHSGTLTEKKKEKIKGHECDHA